MDKTEALTAGLAVAGHLSILADNIPLNVEFCDNAVQIFFPDLRSTLALWKCLSRSERQAWLQTFRTLAIRSRLELHIHVNQHPIARLTPASRPRWFTTALGLDPLEIDLLKLFKVAMRTSPGH